MNVQSRIEPPHDLDIAAFFDWAERQVERYELVEGTPKLHPWVRRNHSKIAANIAFLLQSKLDRDRYDVHQGDFAIRTGSSTIRYADVMVEPSGGAGNARMAENALLIVEILSSSTSSDDFGAKRIEYLGLQSLRNYIIVAQDECRVWQWMRDGGGTWPIEPIILAEGVVSCGDLQIELPIVELYRGITFANVD
jgi:Uma2 family endonuclease